MNPIDRILDHVLAALVGGVLAACLVWLGVHPGHVLAACFGVPAVLVAAAAVVAGLIDNPNATPGTRKQS